MGTGHIAFAALLDHLAGRESAQVAAHVAACESCTHEAAAARRLLEAGRRAATAPTMTKKQRRTARSIFKQAFAPPRVSLLKMVLDSLTQPAPAVRSGAPEARFVRFEGAVTVEMQISKAPRGVEVRGQVTPADYATRVEAEGTGRRRTSAIGPDGTFLFRLPRGETDFRIGNTRINKLRL